MEERRQHIRLSKSFVISFLVSTEILKGETKSKNISEEGICLPLARRLEPGTVVDLDIKVQEGKRPLTARAEVAWVQNRQDSRFPFEAGIKFIKIDPAAKTDLRQRIKKFIDEEGPGQVGWMEHPQK